MKLRRISIKNFRNIKYLDMSLDESSTVIIAKNGEGKSTILDAITVLLGPFVGAFDYGKNPGINEKDVRLVIPEKGYENEAQYPTELQAEGFWETSIHSWTRARNSIKGRTTMKEAANLSGFGKQLQDAIRANGEQKLPLVAYYGTGRLWQTHKNQMKKKVQEESRTMAYEDCLSSYSNYKQLQHWMQQATLADLQNQRNNLPSKRNFSDQLYVICQTVDRFLKAEGFTTFHYSVEIGELAVHHTTSGVLPVSLLSDGIRSMVALVADIAFRCARLNPFLGKLATIETEGIVLIDELDMHLHPSWQQIVLGQLTEAFPKLQFIVTTHSPLLVTTVKHKSVRILKWSGDEVTADVPPFSEGATSQYALENIFDVDSRPEGVEIVKKLNRYQQLLDENKWNEPEALALWEDLLDWGSEWEEEIQRLRMDVELKEYELNHEKSL